MKLLYGCAVVVFFVNAVICGAKDDLPHAPRGLSLSEFNGMLQTEVIHEFGEGVDAEELWDAATAFEWKMAHQVEIESRRRRALRYGRRHAQNNGTDADATDALSPFIVCHLEPGKSAEVRVTEIEALFSVSEEVIVTNTLQRSCFFISSTASIASSVAAEAAASHDPPFVLVHPMAPEMKLENIKEVIDRPYALASQQHQTTSSTHQSQGTEAFDMDRASPSRFNALICPGFPNSLEMANSILDDIRADIGDINDRRRLRSRASSRFLRLREDGESSHRTSDRFGRSLSDGFDTPSACDGLLDAIRVSVSKDVMTVDIDVDPDTLCHDFSRECLHSLAAALSARRELCTVEASPEMLTMNAYAQWITQSGTDGYRPMFDSDLTGEGQVVAVSDTGLDNDNCYFADSARGNTPPTTVDEKRSYDRRKVVQYVGFVDNSDPRGGHGTHVVGTILGRKETGGAETGVSADGVAHGAKVAFFDIGNSNQGLAIPSSASSLLDPGREAGANIHSASWGSFLNSYTAEARAMDEYMVQNPKFLAIIAAGNSGEPGWWSGNSGNIGSPATNKNGIAVGSSQSEGPDGGDRGMYYLSSFSSRGPTGDGRRKPDVTAPGERLRSASADPGMEGECGTVAYPGTSMATPVVAGSAALIRQYYVQGYYPSGSEGGNSIDPSAALVKATLINGAVKLKGIDRGWWGPASTEEYDDNQGFGLINLLNSVPLAGKNTFGAFVKDEESIGNGETDEYTIDISKTGGCTAEEISATLVWTDPVPTSGCSDSCLVNNLDLTVTKGSETFYPNGGSTADNINNVERTRVDAVDGDQFVIAVFGANLIGRQDYALIVTGCLSGEGVSPRPPGPPVPPAPSPPTPTPPTPAPPTGGDEDDNEDPWWCWLFGTCDDDEDD